LLSSRITNEKAAFGISGKALTCCATNPTLLIIIVASSIISFYGV